MKNIITKSKFKILKNVHNFISKINNMLTPKSNIKYLTGDATNPIDTGGMRIIAHVCNDKGGWGAGFVLALSKKWSKPEQVYRSCPVPNLILGNVQYIQVENDIIVANMIAQHGYRRDNNGKPPLRYGALTYTLRKVNEVALAHNATLHMPRIGAGLAGGDWNVIEQLILENVQVPVFIYDLPKK
jgi:O-acetyl-ADP-ribose deacetylase (regulator of RNase III)